MAERWEQDQAFWNDTMQREGAKSDTRLAWWRDAKFGLFIHWGLYSIPAGRWKGKFFKGIGELPFIQQATFSIWDSEKHINRFAYENVNHKKIVDKTRKQKWYSEDLFARFHIISDTGYLRH